MRVKYVNVLVLFVNNFMQIESDYTLSDSKLKVWNNNDTTSGVPNLQFTGPQYFNYLLVQ